MSEIDDDAFEYLPSRSTSCRPDLYIARTRLTAPSGDRYNFWGLFCHNDIQAKEFIGMYAGVWQDVTQGTFPFGNRYAVEFSMLLVAPPGQQPDPQRYPIAMANEPPHNSQANATLQEWIFDRADIDGIPANIKDLHFHGIGLVACKLIPKNTEITWFYGATYDPIRDYVAGAPIQCTSDAHPPHVLGHRLPYDAVSPPLSSPSVSSDDEEYDPKYTSMWNAELRLREMRFRRQTFRTPAYTRAKKDDTTW